MKRAFFFIAAILCLDVTILSAGPQTERVQPFPKELRDPAFLRQLTWHADKKLESVVAGWEKYSNEQYFDDLVIQRLTTVPILEIPFQAEYLTYKAKGDSEIIIEKPNGGVTDCETLFTWAKAAFGQPGKVVDLSRFSTPSLTDTMADWLFGETRVRFWCFAVSLPKDGTIVHNLRLEYSQRERLSALEELVHLECSLETKSGSDDNATGRDLNPSSESKFIVKMDPNHNDLLIDLGNEALHVRPETFSDKEIVGEFETESNVVRVRIDRATDSYVMTSRLKKSNVSDSRVGKCVRVAPSKNF